MIHKIINDMLEANALNGISLPSVKCVGASEYRVVFQLSEPIDRHTKKITQADRIMQGVNGIGTVKKCTFRHGGIMELEIKLNIQKQPAVEVPKVDPVIEPTIEEIKVEPRKRKRWEPIEQVKEIVEEDKETINEIKSSQEVDNGDNQ